MFRDEKVAFIQEEILTTEETCELLGRTRQQLNNYIRKGEIAAVKVTTNGNLFLKDDVVALKNRVINSASYKAGYEDAVKAYGVGTAISPEYLLVPSTLRDFVQEMTSDIKEKEQYSFVLQKYSKHSPYWTVFACKLDTENREIATCGGHYCLACDVKLSEVLDALSESEWIVKVESGFFLEWED